MHLRDTIYKYWSNRTKGDNNSSKSFFRPRILFAVLLLALIIIVGVLSYFFIPDFRSVFITKPPIPKTPEEIIATIKERALLPEGESPKIVDVDAMSTTVLTAYFGTTMKGDKVLIYCRSKHSILFRPNERSIIQIVDAVPDELCANL